MMESIRSSWQQIQTRIQKSDRVYIVPTKLGYLMIAVNFVIFMMGLTYANNMTLLMAFSFFSFLVINMIAANQNLLDLKNILVKISSSYYPGSTLLLTHEGPVAQKIDIELKHLVTKATETSGLYVFNGSAGMYKNTHIKIFSHYPSGLFYVWRFIPISSPFYIYPKPLKWNIDQLTKQGPSAVNQQGDFEHHILYTPELSSKRIDWKIYARTDELYWKKNEGDKATEFNFNLEQMPGKSVKEKIGQLVYAIKYAHETSSRYGLKLGNEFIRPASGHGHFTNCLELVAKHAEVFK